MAKIIKAKIIEVESTAFANSLFKGFADEQIFSWKILKVIFRRLVIEKNKKEYLIYSVQKNKDFEISLPNYDNTKKIAQDIYDNPQNYIEIDEETDGDYYYAFLKYLWVSMKGTPGTIRLVNLVKT